ncbi:MAG: glycine betaine ABC transporter substrate-binding protein [Actinomycetota bacterium]|nr:glycine betaine ABC transporter substrate-binding protein [Actinomycetota bacterium]
MGNATKAVRLTALFAGLALAAACGSDDGGDEGSSGEELSGASLTVGSKEFTEQLILGQMTIQLLENAGAEVEDQTGITGTTNVRQALTSDEIDMYWEYTGTGYSEILGNDIAKAPTDSQELYDAVAEQDQAENGVTWLALSEANNSYAIATSAAAQEETGVESLSDYSELVASDAENATMCAAAEFLDRADGFPGLEKTYGFSLPEEAITEVELGIIYTQLPEGDRCRFGEVFETDGRIPANDLVVLEDDKNFFVKYNLAPTVNEDVLEEYPAIADIMNPVSEALSTETMQQLNSQVDVDNVPAEAVAQTWLEDNDFLG